jgi:hypothetical protein
MLENWCIENRKNSYFRSLDQNNHLNESIHAGIDYSLFGSYSVLADHLLMMCWIDGKMANFNELVSLIESKKISGKTR